MLSDLHLQHPPVTPTQQNSRENQTGQKFSQVVRFHAGGEDEKSKNQPANAEKAAWGGGASAGEDLKNPYQSNPLIDSSRQEVQRSRGRKRERVHEYRTICPSPRAPQITQLADETRARRGRDADAGNAARIFRADGELQDRSSEEVPEHTVGHRLGDDVIVFQ